MAEKSLFQGVARILWGFNIMHAVDEVTGKPIEVKASPHEQAYTDGFVSFPKNFSARFHVRSSDHESTIRRHYASAQDAWEQQGLEVG